MARAPLIHSAAAVLASVSLASGKPASPETDSAYAVQMHARFFEHAKGEFDTADDLDGGGWNAFVSTPIALIAVDVTGAPITMPKGSSIEFSARTRSATLEHRWLSLSDYFSESGQVTIPFLIYGLDCDPIQLRATLRVGTKRLTETRTMPMACGE